MPFPLSWGHSGLKESVAGELLLRGQRIAISQYMRQEVLHKIHNGHQASQVLSQGSRASGGQKICTLCSQHRAEHREPLLTTPVLERPTDFFFWEKTTYTLNVPTANTVIQIMSLVVECLFLQVIVKIGFLLKEEVFCKGYI